MHNSAPVQGSSPAPLCKLICPTPCLPHAAHLDEEDFAIAVAPGEDSVDGGRDAPAIADPSGAGGGWSPAVQQPVVVTCAVRGDTVKRSVWTDQGMDRHGKKGAGSRGNPFLPFPRGAAEGGKAAPAPMAPLRGGQPGQGVGMLGSSITL